MSLRDRTSSCSCNLPRGAYGRSGWHWQTNPKHPEAPQCDIAYERCAAFVRSFAPTSEAQPNQRAARGRAA